MLLCGYSGLYVPEPKAFHVRGGTIGAIRSASLLSGPERPDHPAQGPAGLDLLRSLPKIALYHYVPARRGAKEGVARTTLRAYAAFMRTIPATLRKRRSSSARADNTRGVRRGDPDGLPDAHASGTLPPMRTAVALILFRRPEQTGRVFERIEARPNRLFLIADGPRPIRRGRGARLRAGARRGRAVDWPCEVVRDFADENLGLKRRIPSGLDRVFSEVDEAIILEDDCLPHPSFFPTATSSSSGTGTRSGSFTSPAASCCRIRRSQRATTSRATCISGAGLHGGEPGASSMSISPIGTRAGGGARGLAAADVRYGRRAAVLALRLG